MSKHNHQRNDRDTRDYNVITHGLGCLRSKRNVMHSRRDYRRKTNKRERAKVRRILLDERDHVLPLAKEVPVAPTEPGVTTDGQPHG